MIAIILEGFFSFLRILTFKQGTKTQLKEFIC